MSWGELDVTGWPWPPAIGGSLVVVDKEATMVSVDTDPLRTPRPPLANAVSTLPPLIVAARCPRLSVTLEDHRCECRCMRL